MIDGIKPNIEKEIQNLFYFLHYRFDFLIIIICSPNCIYFFKNLTTWGLYFPIGILDNYFLYKKNHLKLKMYVLTNVFILLTLYEYKTAVGAFNHRRKKTKI